MLLLLAAGVGGSAGAAPPRPDHSKVPGVVIDHSPASTGRFIGSPSIAILQDGRYIASHDIFGPGAPRGKESGTTVVFSSSDRGHSWRKIAEVRPLFWAKLFVRRGDLYALGTTHGCSDLILRRSRDGGRTWTSPTDATTGRLTAEGRYHCAPCPVLIHDNRVWRSVEKLPDVEIFRRDFRTLVASAPADADLLNATKWTFSTPLPASRAWLGLSFRSWLEGNVVVTPDSHVVNILRVETYQGGKAAMVHISDDGRTASFDPTKDFVDLPGGEKKFTIRYDRTTRRYWSLVNYIRPRDAGKARASSIRNTLALASSPNLRTWTVHCVLLEHPDIEHVGFQYLDWLFDGEDIVGVARTAYDDGLGGAHRAHDANYLTFHRISGFRRKASQTIVGNK
jgi:hypothetical protein